MTNTTRLPDPSTATEEEILNAAESILLNRIKRIGTITDPTEASRFFRVRIGHMENEEFHVMYLDTRHRVIEVEMLFRGTIDGAEVHPRVIVQRALHFNAAALIVAHNHPSGSAEPSAADRAVTARLKQALGLVDIRLVDHLVVAPTDITSLAARGWV